ncbi:hypothetical protein CKAH01_09604 [Colletotrichum kahawae]|uniref:Uncharacterized protein n=1 Tax=Colletotrichum kahawae TaxID=34407 RepID=A0AAD9Y0P1_COLKA|nr:hypothetical protein CKAH01_09604 [Colletotrichum kahawae]
MSFGWSAGDIAAAVKLLYDVYHTLDNVDGAAGEYREAVTFLKSLTQILEPLKTLTDWDAYPAYGDEIKREVFLIKAPIEVFLASRTYEEDLRIQDCVSTLDDDLRFYLQELKQAIGDSRKIQSALQASLRLGPEASQRNRQIPEATYQSRRRSLPYVLHRYERLDDFDDRSETLKELLLLVRLMQPRKQLAPNLIAKYHITFLDVMGGAPRVLQYDAFRSFEASRFELVIGLLL